MGTENYTDDMVCDPRFQDRVLSIAANGLDPSGSNGPLSELGHRLATSRASILQHKAPMKIGVVFAMWRETKRLSARSHQNPSGEDCLLVKARALDWLFRETNFDWSIYAVDDGCDEGSAEVAEKIARSSKWHHKISVLSLRSKTSAPPPLRQLPTIEGSVKGGAIAIGCAAALQDGCDYIAYTDCDNSVHIGQLGNLLHPLVTHSLDFAMGDRTMPASKLWRSPARYSSSRYVILKHIRTLLCQAVGLSDFTTPLKVFSARCMEDALADLTIFDFSFDYDIVFSAISKGYWPLCIPYSSYDSFTESSWHHFGTCSIWRDQFEGLVSSLRKHGIPHDVRLAEFVATRLNTTESIEELVGALVPSQLVDITSADVGQQSVFSTADLLRWANAATAL